LAALDSGNSRNALFILLLAPDCAGSDVRIIGLADPKILDTHLARLHASENDLKLQYRHSRHFQHSGEPDQRQADQAAGIVALQSLKQGNAQTFGFKTARALIGLFPPQITVNLRLGQHPEYHPKYLYGDLPLTAGAIEQT
jgi:hypothetical protein